MVCSPAFFEEHCQDFLLSFRCNFALSVGLRPGRGMCMSHRTLLLGVWLLVIATLAAIGNEAAAQTTPVRVQQPAPIHPGGPVQRVHPRQMPCWEVAGISKGAMDQRRAIQQRTRAEVEAVCAETSLTPQQRQQKIRQIHEQSKHEMDALVTPQQMEELKSCQMSRSHGGGQGGGHPGVGGHGPCGEMPPAKSGPKPPSGSKPETAEPDED